MRPHGESILEIVRSVPGLPRQFLTQGIVCINGEVVPRNMWALVRPKPTSEYVPINVTLHFPLQGGGRGGGNKSVIALVAAIALLVVTAFIAGPAGLAAVGGFEGLAAPVAFGITGAQLLAGAVGIAGALAISALTAPPVSADNTLSGGENTDNKESAGASANIIDPGGAIPRVIGSRKIFPPLICEPVVEMIQGDEFVEAVYALNGPHGIADIRIDGASLDSVADVSQELREGLSTDTPLTLVTRIGRTIAPNVTLTQHQTLTNGFDLLDQTTPTNSLPIFHRVASKRDPDEMWMQFVLPGGIVDANALSSARVIPLRIRMRLAALGGGVAGAWINLPELHLCSLEGKALRKDIRFVWTAQGAIATPPAPTASYGWVAAIREVPGQTAAPADPGVQWTAHSYFDDGSGSEALIASTVGSSRVINVDLFEHSVIVYLGGSGSPDLFPQTFATYEFEVMRGYSFAQSTLNYSTYNIGGTGVKNFFKYVTSGTKKTFVTQQSVSQAISLVRLVSIWHTNPVQTTGDFTLLALKARNRSLTRVSLSAQSKVPDWDGSAWTGLVETSNPAAHYRDILAGAQNLDPLDNSLIDNDSLVAWRALCISNGWHVDAIIDDMRTQDVLALDASCGYARPYQSDVYGVTVDNDRTGDTPIQIFSRVNARNVRWERAFARVPYGFIVTYRDDAQDNDRAQLIVLQSDPSIATTGMFESVSYEGLTDADDVEIRARFDLDQANLRSSFYHLETDLESIVCRRGSLVGLQHDTIAAYSGDARVLDKIVGGGSPVQVTGLLLDCKVTISPTGTTGCAIRHENGSITTHQLSNAPGTETNTITFTTPFTDDGSINTFNDSGQRLAALVTFGLLHTEYRRMLVQAVTPGQNLTAQLTLVDEAPTLVRS